MTNNFLFRQAEPKVFIIILHWKRQTEIVECLQSVFDQNYTNFEVIVVNNEVESDTIWSIKNKFKTIHLINNGCNLGFAKGNNVGIRYAIDRGAEFVWLLNNDTIVEKDCLSKLIVAAQEDNLVGMLSPIIYYYDDPNKWQFAGSKIDINNVSIIYPNENCNNLEMYQKGENICLWGTA